MSKARFTELDGSRGTFIKRCEKYASWTIPSVFPAPDTNDSDEMFTDYQSHGAKLVNNLSNKLSIAMFAPSRPFFRLRISQEIRDAIKEKYQFDDPTIDVTLSLTAKEGMQVLERASARPALIRAMKLLIITGNTVVHQVGKDKGIKLRTYSVRNYVAQRDVNGTVIELVTRDTSVLSSMTAVVQKAFRDHNPDAKGDTKVSLYMHCIYNGERDSWQCKQYIEDIPVPYAGSSYASKDFPYAVLVWDLAEGRHYGDGLVEQHQGDFHGLSELSAAFMSGLAEMCRIVHLVNPMGDTNAKEYAGALSGDCIAGRADDIVTPDLGGKNRDYATVAAKIERIERALSEAFLYAQNAMRNAERVTAEEVRMVQRELEAAFGGIYSQLATDLQAWLANSIVKQLKLPFGDGAITPVVRTGIDAMSADGDLENIQLLLNDLGGAAALPAGVQERLDWDGLVKVIAGYRQVEFYKFLLSEDQVQKNRQAAMQAQQQMQQAAVNSQEQAKAKGAIATHQATQGASQ
jgi:hypothetical protein